MGEQTRQARLAVRLVRSPARPRSPVGSEAGASSLSDWFGVQRVLAVRLTGLYRSCIKMERMTGGTRQSFPRVPRLDSI